MNTDEINRYIHEEIMGNHIHTPTLNEADDTVVNLAPLADVVNAAKGEANPQLSCIDSVTS